MARLTLTVEIPDDLAQHIIEIGDVEAARTMSRSDYGHALDFLRSLVSTRRYFGLVGRAESYFVAVGGGEANVCITGTSPASSMRARIFAGLWNDVRAALLARVPAKQRKA